VRACVCARIRQNTYVVFWSVSFCRNFLKKQQNSWSQYPSRVEYFLLYVLSKSVSAIVCLVKCNSLAEHNLSLILCFETCISRTLKTMGSIYQLTLLLSLFGSLLITNTVEASKTKRHHGKKGREELSPKKTSSCVAQASSMWKTQSKPLSV
jgi:hypothetical protein